MAHRSTTPDVLVIGGGLIGCSIALRLAQQKLRVTLVERGEPGAEASSAGAGMIAPQGETVEPDEFFALCAASRDLYPEFVREVEEASGERVYLRRDGTLAVAFGEGDLDAVYTGQRNAGLPIERLTAAEARRRAPVLSPEISEALLLANDFWLDNERLIHALAQACRANGVEFQSHTQVKRLIVRSGRVEKIDTESEGAELSFSAGEFVLAAGAWSGELARSAGIPLPIQPCRGQMIEFEGAERFPVAVRAGHHYFVPRPNGRLIAGSTMEYVGYEKAVTGEGLCSILEAAIRMAPGVRQLRFRRCWAGLRPDTQDHRPVLGRGELANLTLATGHFRNGILLTPITAKLISELIVSGKPGAALAPYGPERFSRAHAVV